MVLFSVTPPDARGETRFLNEGEVWKNAFDPENPLEYRKGLISMLRNEEKNPTSYFSHSWDTEPWMSAFRKLPDALYAVLVMVGVYEYRNVIPVLQAAGKLAGVIHISYSSGLHDIRPEEHYSLERLFKNGMSMRGIGFMPEDDVRTAVSNRRAPFMILDDDAETGVTLAAVGNIFRRVLGHEGDMYEMTRDFKPRPWTGRLSIPEEERKKNPKGYEEVIRRAASPPVYTERGPLEMPALRKASGQQRAKSLSF